MALKHLSVHLATGHVHLLFSFPADAFSQKKVFGAPKRWRPRAELENRAFFQDPSLGQSPKPSMQ